MGVTVKFSVPIPAGNASSSSQPSAFPSQCMQNIPMDISTFSLSSVTDYVEPDIDYIFLVYSATSPNGAIPYSDSYSVCNQFNAVLASNYHMLQFSAVADSYTQCTAGGAWQVTPLLFCFVSDVSIMLKYNTRDHTSGVPQKYLLVIATHSLAAPAPPGGHSFWTS